MTDQQKQIVARFVATSKNGNVNSYKIANRLSTHPKMLGLSTKDIEAEILRICPQFNSL